MTTARANAIVQSRTRSDRKFEARLLADAEYVAVRTRIQALPASRSDRTDAQQSEYAALIARKYEISDRVAS